MRESRSLGFGVVVLLSLAMVCWVTPALCDLGEEEPIDLGEAVVEPIEVVEEPVELEAVPMAEDAGDAALLVADDALADFDAVATEEPAAAPVTEEAPFFVEEDVLVEEAAPVVAEEEMPLVVDLPIAVDEPAPAAELMPAAMDQTAAELDAGLAQMEEGISLLADDPAPAEAAAAPMMAEPAPAMMASPAEVSEALGMEEAIERPAPVAPSAGGPGAELALLLDALHRKDTELQESKAELKQAKAEVTRLQDIVKKIWEANRREKLNLYYNLGCVYRAAREYQKAAAIFQKALELDPNDADVHYNLAILYDDDLQNKDQARTHYQRFLELAPDDEGAERVREWLGSMR